MEWTTLFLGMAIGGFMMYVILLLRSRALAKKLMKDLLEFGAPKAVEEKEYG